MATVKAPDARKRARVVVCGNMIEPSLSNQDEVQDVVGVPSKKKDWSNYASGLDGTAMRMVLRLAGHHQWTVGSIDVKTAFLLAPRRGRGLLAVRPPRILVQAKIIDENELWLVDRALYGLQASPADWSCFRDHEMTSWTWSKLGRSFFLRVTEEPNLWQVVEQVTKTDDGSTVEADPEVALQVVGFLVVYVDDLMVVADGEVAGGLIEKVQATWTCSTPSWLSSTEPLKFCGFELLKGEKKF